jgi:hypothetical protein
MNTKIVRGSRPCGSVYRIIARWDLEFGDTSTHRSIQSELFGNHCAALASNTIFEPARY